ncbi:uncharacterized protein [Ptychodera flava]|uniref:uncharacterized protein isoform X1 n=1 Tax=Ptychodera flava TaxID=63121 RepID=UPI00396A84DB
MTRIVNPRKSSRECSRYTLVSRSRSVTNVRQQMSGDSVSAVVQAKDEMKRIQRTENQSIVDLLGLAPNTPPGAGLALKTDLGITWSTLRKLRRWLRQWKCPIGAESKDRQLANTLKLDVKTLMLPFTFPVRGIDGSRLSEVRLAPCIAVTNLVDAVLNRLDALERYFATMFQLTCAFFLHSLHEYMLFMLF